MAPAVLLEVDIVLPPLAPQKLCTWFSLRDPVLFLKVVEIGFESNSGSG
jgi:hypothetical protein